MASNYPSGYDTFRTIANVPGETFDASKTTRVYAEDLRYLQEDVVAVENTLGLNPQGGSATVKARLDSLDTTVAGKQDTLGFTPENVANKSTSVTTDQASNTKYPSVKAVYDWAVATFQAALGFTPENVANKKTSLTDNSDTYYPSQKAVKTAVDAKQDALGFTAENVANKDTDGTLAANSDTKYASQKATKTYADGKVSDTAYGSSWNGVTDIAPSKNAVYDEIETLSGTIPSVQTCVQVVPHPVGVSIASNLDFQLSTNTKLRLALFYIPFKITANKVSIRITNQTVSGTYKLVMYSEDGQTKVFEVTTGTTSANTTLSPALSAVVINPGFYYFGVLANSTVNCKIATWGDPGAVSDVFEQIASEPVLVGFVTVTASTIPSTITPTSITWESNVAPMFRLDN